MMAAIMRALERQARGLCLRWVVCFALLGGLVQFGSLVRAVWGWL